MGTLMHHYSPQPRKRGSFSPMLPVPCWEQACRTARSIGLAIRARIKGTVSAMLAVGCICILAVPCSQPRRQTKKRGGFRLPLSDPVPHRCEACNAPQDQHAALTSPVHDASPPPPTRPATGPDMEPYWLPYKGCVRRISGTPDITRLEYSAGLARFALSFQSPYLIRNHQDCNPNQPAP